MQKPKGTKDVFGNDWFLKEKIKNILINHVLSFNYQPIETPIFERYEVFSKTLGEVTEIAQKQMYVFEDKQNRKMVLKPEMTASVVRAFMENNFNNQNQFHKLFYFSPLFRYENPQKGRQRQFNQFGVECFLKKTPFVDAEVIHLAYSILDTFKIDHTLVLNCLGSLKERKFYIDNLKNYFKQYQNNLSDISKENIEKNPLRIFDSKLKNDQEICDLAPKIFDFLNLETKNYFNEVLEILKNMNINFKIDYKLVRGLDYYNDLVFEFIPNNQTGQQSTIIGGGRYDELTQKMGGPKIDAIGFSIGFERLLLNLKDSNQFIDKPYLDYYVINLSSNTFLYSQKIINILRSNFLKVDHNWNIKSLNKLFDLADKYNSKNIIIIGDKEYKDKTITIKTKEKQLNIKLKELNIFLKKGLN